MDEEVKIEPGFLLINKPANWTSFDVVAYVRRVVRNAPSPSSSPPCLPPACRQAGQGRFVARGNKLRVGHAGTLDPFATGLLIVGVGREATKRLDEFKNLKKTYVATIFLGATSDTQDRTGKIEDQKIGRLKDWQTPNTETIKKTIKNFLGKQSQIPPMYSAKKINGQKLYNLARKGIEVERQPNEIEIYNIKLLDYNWPRLKIEVECSAGTYIRTLATDIGEVLGCGAYCEELQRTAIGPYSIEQAQKIEN